MGSSSADPRPKLPAFTAEAIGAAATVAHGYYGFSIPSMAMEAILQAGFAAQEAGDGDIVNCRSIRRTLEWEIRKLKAEQEQLEHRVTGKRMLREEVDSSAELQQHLEVILETTKRRYRKSQAFVAAWERVAEWLGIKS